jgi:prepilin-type N-terminal cleavage/methylation domain-containing protein
MLRKLRYTGRKTLPGFTLIELAVVLIIMGVLTGAILKGQDLLEIAKIRGVIADINRYRLGIALYQETYGALPGDDAYADSHFTDADNGDGDGIIAGDEATYFWRHLAKAGHTASPQPPSSKLGGIFTVAYDPFSGFKGHFLILSNPRYAGLLTPRQAHMLKAKADDGRAQEGLIRFTDGVAAGGHKCLTQTGDFDITHNHTSCILLVSF